MLFAGFVLTGIVNTVLGPVLPWLTARWSLSDVGAGSLFTVQFAGGLAGGAISGVVASRIGAGRTMAFGHAMMAAGLAGLALGSAAMGWFSVFLAGLGLGFVVPPTNLLAARLAPHRPAAALGAVNLCWGLGAAIWPLMVIASAERAGVGVALLVTCALLIVMAAGIAPVPYPADAAHPAIAGGSRDRRLGQLAIFGICIALYSGTEAAFGGWITEFARRLAGPGAHGWEVAASAFWGGVAGGRGMVSIWLTKRLEQRAIVAGLALVGAALTVLLVVPRIELVLVAAVACGLGLAPVFPVTVAALSREFPTSLAGPMVAMGSVGAGLLPLVVGAISDRTGSLSSGFALLLMSTAVLSALTAVRLRAPGSRIG
jgi:MFS transporter, FHS family, glucose/mannose:H+ symporter